MKKFMHSAFRIRTDIYRPELCFNIFSIHVIVVYSFRRLLCCWPGWGDIFLLPQNIQFQQHPSVSFSYKAHFSTVSVDSYKPTNVVRVSTLLEQ